MRLLLLLFLFCSCNLSGDDKAADAPTVTYSYACLDSVVSGGKGAKAVRKTADVIRNLAVDDDRITDAVQTEYGVAFHRDAIAAKTFVLLNDKAINAELQLALNELLAVRQSPSAIQYAIYLLNDDQVNAFTFGGRIYVTKAMYDKCKGSRAVLYFIIGHEIGHSERGHIKKTIQDMMLSEKIFGNGKGEFFLTIKKLLTGSFNQRNELEADYYGTDLTNALHQDVCSAVTFWKGMAEAENSYSKLEDFFRTHPFSSLRAECLRQHIEKNFGSACSIQQSGKTNRSE